MKIKQCSETSAYKIQTPGNYPGENIQHTENGESLKSRISFFPVSIIPSILHTRLQLSTTRIRRTSGRILWNFKHNNILSDVRVAVDTALSLHTIFTLFPTGKTKRYFIRIIMLSMPLCSISIESFFREGLYVSYAIWHHSNVVIFTSLSLDEKVRDLWHNHAVLYCVSSAVRRSFCSNIWTNWQPAIQTSMDVTSLKVTWMQYDSFIFDVYMSYGWGGGLPVKVFTDSKSVPLSRSLTHRD